MEEKKSAKLKVGKYVFTVNAEDYAVYDNGCAYGLCAKNRYAFQEYFKGDVFGNITPVMGKGMFNKLKKTGCIFQNEKQAAKRKAGNYSYWNFNIERMQEVLDDDGLFKKEVSAQ